MERVLDIVLSILAISVLLPMLVPVCLILRITGEGEIFFSQKRIGRGGQEFNLLKFATMLKNSPNIGSGTVTMKDDPRILPFGKLLRKTKINELPQLVNVFMGDMSLIGPRPLTRQTFDAYTAETRTAVLEVRPGLSGVGSIIFRGEEELMQGSEASIDFYNEVIAPYKGNLEQWYVQHKGIRTYLLAIFVTIVVVIRPNSGLAWALFRNLPEPPNQLANSLFYPTGS